ncbi:uncharacterized protein TrAtP1_008099 [Trichoderma atroviride]|uniref:uncharacterized protein n=1 Tax=Hypocrea atroviridis TaxID=63577 RepID=UPI00331BA9F2|nr:hypothetical protein TrAtP1_008099 [Trichoderma atroviride]
MGPVLASWSAPCPWITKAGCPSLGLGFSDSILAAAAPLQNRHGARSTAAGCVVDPPSAFIEDARCVVSRQPVDTALGQLSHPFVLRLGLGCAGISSPAIVSPRLASPRPARAKRPFPSALLSRIPRWTTARARLGAPDACLGPLSHPHPRS